MTGMIRVPSVVLVGISAADEVRASAVNVVIVTAAKVVRVPSVDEVGASVVDVVKITDLVGISAADGRSLSIRWYESHRCGRNLSSR